MITSQDFNWSEAGGGMVHGGVPQFRSPGPGSGTTRLHRIVATHRKTFDTANIAVNINVSRDKEGSGFNVRLNIEDGMVLQFGSRHNFSAALWNP